MKNRSVVKYTDKDKPYMYRYQGVNLFKVQGQTITIYRQELREKGFDIIEA